MKKWGLVTGSVTGSVRRDSLKGSVKWEGKRNAEL